MKNERKKESRIGNLGIYPRVFASNSSYNFPDRFLNLNHSVIDRIRVNIDPRVSDVKHEKKIIDTVLFNNINPSHNN